MHLWYIFIVIDTVANETMIPSMVVSLVIDGHILIFFKCPQNLSDCINYTKHPFCVEVSMVGRLYQDIFCFLTYLNTFN